MFGTFNWPLNSLRQTYNCIVLILFRILQAFASSWLQELWDWSKLDWTNCMFITDEKIGRDVKKFHVLQPDSDDMKCVQVIDRQDLDFTEQLWDLLRGDQTLWA